MKKYSYQWKTKSICVWEEGKQIDSIALPYNDSDINFLESFFDDGNFIMSNKYSKSSNPYTYQHYFISENDEGYTIIKGKKWDDGLWRFFDTVEAGVLEVTLCHDRSTTLYNCLSFVEYKEREKPVVKTKSQ